MGFFGIIFFVIFGCMVLYQIVANNHDSPEYKAKYGWDNEGSIQAKRDFRNMVIFLLIAFLIFCLIFLPMLPYV